MINGKRGSLTSPSRSASGCFLMYSRSSPPGIQFEMSWREVVVTPRKGKTFGCVKRFQITTSWQKTCELCELWQTGDATALKTLLRLFLDHP